MSPQPATSSPTVIDLTDAAQLARVRVRVAPADNPFVRMTDAERMRLFIRVICELVAYDDEPADDQHTPAAASAAQAQHA